MGGRNESLCNAMSEADLTVNVLLLVMEPDFPGSVLRLGVSSECQSEAYGNPPWRFSGAF